ncbi:MAG: DUF1318 domain-containing protein [Spirochaetes bacterium]|nr:DUF1318 domain-containing protein [Spirochaetota bacterium]
MHRAIIFMAIALGAAAALAAGCSSMSNIPSCCWIAPPEISLTGQKTVIERQIVGDYRELEKDAWVVSSVKTNMAGTKGSRDDEIFAAFRKRAELKDAVRRYMDEGAVGETNLGLLGYVGTPAYERDANQKKALMAVMGQENGARKTIFRRTLVKTGIASPSEEQVTSLGRRFAEEQRAFAKVNDWIQGNDGKWSRKK